MMAAQMHQQVHTLKQIFWATGIVWTLVLVGALTWQIHSISSMNWEMAHREARANFNKDQAFRLWASGHGGVYVPITAATPPNPRLSHIPDRDIETPSGKKLTLMNPAYMVRQLNEQSRELYGVVGHITSNKLMRAENAPDAWERDALAQFESGTKEVVSAAEIDGEPFLRMMQPMIAQKGCLKCHAFQGYAEGDIRGGVSAAVPLQPYLANMRHGSALAVASFGGIWLLGIAGLVVGHRRLRGDLVERLHAEEAVRSLNAELESRVEARTKELQSANIALHESLMDLHRAQNRLVESEKVATDANRAKSAFMANMSHELRTPMNAILGFAQLLQNDLSLSEDQRGKVNTIVRSGHLLLDLITDVLEISKIEAGKVTVESRAFDMLGLFDAIRDIIQPHADEKGLALDIVLAPDLPQYVHGDDKKLRQVLVNLLSNAIKFTNRGRIVLRVTLEAGSRLRFEVTDSGCGIAPEDLSRIFEAFYQTADAVKRGEGTGLGLTISHQYVALMDGTLEVESERGKGSQFTFAIPLKSVQSVDLKTPKSDRRVIGIAPGQPRYRVLVAEDQPDSRHLLQQLLESVGFEVRVAETGERALNLFHSWRPHLIWMDMRMPVMDGYEATKRIKSSPLGRDTAVLALTASAFEEDRAEVLAAGCDGFLRKPLNVEEVFNAMAEHLNVRYVYADAPKAESTISATALNPAALTALKPELCAALRQAALLLNTQQARSAIAEIAEQAPELAAPLGRLVDEYRFDLLLKLCDEPLRPSCPRHE